MTESVTEKEVAAPDKEANHDSLDNKELNFRRLEAERQKDREARLRAEWEAQQLKTEMQKMQEMLKPKEKDPLDDEDLDPDLRSKLQQIRERDRQEFLKASRDIARQTFEEEKGRDKRENPVGVLKKEFSDYDSYMNEDTIRELEESHPEFTQALLNMPDEYERRKLAYNYVKKIKSQKPSTSIQDKVKENQQNPYYTPASAGTPSAADFDIRSPAARQAAYAQLKANQKRPIGMSQ
jgi:hypothetical protein